jgi:hypothetical protein
MKRQKRRANELISVYGGGRAHLSFATSQGSNINKNIIPEVRFSIAKSIMGSKQAVRGVEMSNMHYDIHNEPKQVVIQLIEDRPNFQTLSDITRAEEMRRANGSTSAMA